MPGGRLIEASIGEVQQVVAADDDRTLDGSNVAHARECTHPPSRSIGHMTDRDWVP